MDDLKKKQKKLMTKLAACQDMIKGSLIALCTSCNRVNCICQTKSGNIAYRLTYKKKNQTSKIMYVPAGMFQETKRRIELFEEGREIIEELIDNNLIILKNLSKQHSEKNK